jgi:hypothetical protein
MQLFTYSRGSQGLHLTVQDPELVPAGGGSSQPLFGLPNVLGGQTDLRPTIFDSLLLRPEMVASEGGARPQLDSIALAPAVDSSSDNRPEVTSEELRPSIADSDTDELRPQLASEALQPSINGASSAQEPPLVSASARLVPDIDDSGPETEPADTQSENLRPETK